jgi:2-desacetyl-2-hydroxyethyl bacteriochlorophyllide A dehydrogenase
MSCRRLIFAAPQRVTLETGPAPRPGAGELLVRTRLSAISAGTEMLVFRGLFPEGLAVDAAIPALSAGPFAYPLAYGYCCVGQVTEAGAGVAPGWVDRRVFAFQPHQSHFVCRPEDLLPLPEGLGPEDAVLLAAMETAVNLVMDGRPVVGERAVVVGLGMTGLLTLGLLACHPLACLVGVDLLNRRREAALNLGATEVSGEERATGDPGGGADLVYELTGHPEALDTALAYAGYGTRVVIGSWYGARRAALDLGGRFHRDRVRLVSSQVSTIAPAFSGRWTKARRLAVAWEMLSRLRPGGLISHRFPVEEAQRAYEQVAYRPEETLQVVLTYPD